MAQNTPAASGNKTIGPLPGCQLEEALALVWDVFSTFESQDLPQEALDSVGWTKEQLALLSVCYLAQLLIGASQPFGLPAGQL